MTVNTALRRLLSGLLLAGLLLTLTTGALAERPDRNGHNKGAGRQHSQQTAGITPQQAMARAQQRYPGKVLSVRRNNGSYQVKMLHEGKVRYVTISAH